MRARSRRVHLDGRRLSHLLEPRRAGQTPTQPRALPPAAPAHQSQARFDFRLQVRGLRANRLPIAPAHLRARRGPKMQ